MDNSNYRQYTEPRIYILRNLSPIARLWCPAALNDLEIGLLLADNEVLEAEEYGEGRRIDRRGHRVGGKALGTRVVARKLDGMHETRFVVLSSLQDDRISQSV